MALKKTTVTRTQGFAATIRVKDGGVKGVAVASPRFYQHQINKFRDGEQVTLEIHNERPKRTEAQNRYYWGVYLPLVSNETGEADIDRLHELFKGKFLTQGIVEVLGEKVRLKKSTTELGVGEFCDYIMNIQNLTGVEAPPTESFGLVSLKDGLVNDK